MITPAQIRGMFLEEALLYLLRVSGYRTINHIERGDITLLKSGAGLHVKGRGCDHQIDAIADFAITPPFTYPQRLLVEAKNLRKHVDIEVVRNALGVLRDIQEYWVPTKMSVPTKKRFHYQYAIASTSGYSEKAEKFAYAHDIFLIPLSRARYFQPITTSIREFDSVNIYQTDQQLGSFQDFRLAIRQKLYQSNSPLSQSLRLTQEAVRLVENFIESCIGVNRGVIALLDRRFPIFLVPNPRIRLDELPAQSPVNVRIFWDDEGWYINSASDGQKLFSFDMPEEMLRLYLEGGNLSGDRALDLKQENLREIQFILTLGKRINFVTLRLDMEWINHLRQRIQR